MYKFFELRFDVEGSEGVDPTWVSVTKKPGESFWRVSLENDDEERIHIALAEDWNTAAEVAEARLRQLSEVVGSYLKKLGPP